MPVVDGDRVLGVISETDILFKERMSPDRKGSSIGSPTTARTRPWQSWTLAPQARR
jgi:CBS domain-containing protein